jgi:hypothetical protein
VRRAGVVAVATVLALAGTVGVIAFFQARDDANIGGEQSGPGVEAPGETGERLRAGNVLLTYRSPADADALRALADEVAGPPDPALEEAGQAILVERRPDQSAPIVARAFQRRLEARSADDPALRAFAEAWLGQGAMP